MDYGELLRIMTKPVFCSRQLSLAWQWIYKKIITSPCRLSTNNNPSPHYLDTKTAQIDRKIDLLSQKAAQYGKLKQSLINETVTRGLDKSVAMKDSGVEWIGEVPAHWG